MNTSFIESIEEIINLMPQFNNLVQWNLEKITRSKFKISTDELYTSIIGEISKILES